MRNNYHEIKEVLYTEYEASSSDYDINTIEKCEFDTFLCDFGSKKYYDILAALIYLAYLCKRNIYL